MWKRLPASQQFLLSSAAPVSAAVAAVQWLANQTIAMGITGVGMSYTMPEFLLPAQY